MQGDTEMKPRQNLIAILSLIAPLSSLSPLAAADSEVLDPVPSAATPEGSHRIILTEQQMDQLTAGRFRDATSKYFFNFWMNATRACLQNEAVCSPETAAGYLATAQGIYDNQWVED
jgi:hypothetical protein